MTRAIKERYRTADPKERARVFSDYSNNELEVMIHGELVGVAEDSGEKE